MKEIKTNWKTTRVREREQNRRKLRSKKLVKKIINILRVKIPQHETRTGWHKKGKFRKQEISQQQQKTIEEVLQSNNSGSRKSRTNNQETSNKESKSMIS